VSGECLPFFRDKLMKRSLYVGLMSLVALAAIVLSRPAFVFSQQKPSQSVDTTPTGLKVGGAVVTPLDLSAADLKSLPRKTMKTVNPHSQKDESYEGVALRELLHRAGTPEGENLRGAAMATYVIAEGADGYRVVFSLAELDPGIVDSEVMVADTLDGAPLDGKHGPFQLVVPHDKRAARWVRMLNAITVAQPGK
jgi:DMSO/TMAO reductase YedYZ molybdopterin-dependent catalytic subunit